MKNHGSNVTLAVRLPTLSPLSSILPTLKLQLTSLIPQIRSFRNLSPRTRLTVGLGILAWGAIGLYVSDTVEKKFGFESNERDKEALGEVMPKITVVEKD
jgi:hypothetical protein